MTLKLNIGCGDDRREAPWVNVDLRADVADVVCDAWQLDSVWERGTIDELLALDLLEHFSRANAPNVLAHWYDMLRPGGLLTVRVPNLLALAKQLVIAHDVEVAHPTPIAPLVDDTIENIYGAHRWGTHGALDAHHWGYTPTTLARALEAAGFAVLSNDERHNMTAIAQR